MIETVLTDVIAEADMDATEVVSAEYSMKKALAGSDHMRAIKAIYYASPFLEETTKKLARTITHCYPDARGGGLLRHAIEEASMAYVEAAEGHDRMEEQDFAYLKVLIERAAHLVDHSAHVIKPEGTSEAWPMIEVPLIDFAKKTKAQRVVFSPVTEHQHYRYHGMMLILAGRLLTTDHSEVILALKGAWDVA